MSVNKTTCACHDLQCDIFRPIEIQYTNQDIYNILYWLHHCNNDNICFKINKYPCPGSVYINLLLHKIFKSSYFTFCYLIYTVHIPQPNPQLPFIHALLVVHSPVSTQSLHHTCQSPQKFTSSTTNKKIYRWGKIH